MTKEEFITFLIETIMDTADKTVSKLEDEKDTVAVEMEDGSIFFLVVEEG